MSTRAAFSVGHGTASPAQFLDRLAPGAVRAVWDVRTAPGSRRHPHLSAERMAGWLAEAGIGYRWEPRLGGFRRPAPDSPDIVWRNSAFRGYAGHLRSPEARAALDALAGAAAGEPTAFMCSETVWWRCHRRLIADALVLLHGFTVHHLMPGRMALHEPTPGVRVADGQLCYDRGDTSRLERQARQT